MATSARVNDHSDHHAGHCFSYQYLSELVISMGTVSAGEVLRCSTAWPHLSTQFTVKMSELAFWVLRYRRPYPSMSW